VPLLLGQRQKPASVPFPPKTFSGWWGFCGGTYPGFMVWGGDLPPHTSFSRGLVSPPHPPLVRPPFSLFFLGPVGFRFQLTIFQGAPPPFSPFFLLVFSKFGGRGPEITRGPFLLLSFTTTFGRATLILFFPDPHQFRAVITAQGCLYPLSSQPRFTPGGDTFFFFSFLLV